MSKKKIKIFLVDDHQIVRDGIRALLLGSPEISIVGEASDGEEMMKKLETDRPDIILMDISLPGISGIDLTRQAVQKLPEVKVIILSMFTNEEYITNALAAGAKSYLPKNTTQQELLTAISKVYEGKEYYSDTISKIIFENFVTNVRKVKDTEPVKDEELLSSREKQILRLCVEGQTNQEIADHLYISIRTVESHKNHIMQKLGVKNTVELVKYAIRNNIAKA